MPAAGLVFDKPTFISSGDDSRARVWQMDGKFYPDLTPLPKQTASLSQLDNDPEGDFVTGTWEGFAVIWNKGKISQRLDGHQYSTQVLGLPGGGFVLASANKEIHFYDRARKLIKRVTGAHNRMTNRELAWGCYFVCGFFFVCSFVFIAMDAVPRRRRQEAGA